MNSDNRTYPIVNLGFLVNPDLPITGYSEVINDAVCLTHAHPRAQLLYATTGVMKVVVENQIWVVNPLQGLWLPSYIEHQVDFQKDVTLYSVFIDSSLTNTLPQSSFSFDISCFLKELLFKIISFGSVENFSDSQRRIMDVFLDEIKEIRPGATFLPMTNHPKLKTVVEALMNDLSSKSKIAYYADLISMSSKTLSRLFAKELGMTFSDWRTRLKLLEAIKRLGEKQSVKEIAFDLGYEDTSAFIFMFKKNLGQTPATYIFENEKA